MKANSEPTTSTCNKKGNSEPTGRKRSFQQLSPDPRNIAFETKRDIDRERKRIKKLQKEKNKLINNPVKVEKSENSGGEKLLSPHNCGEERNSGEEHNREASYNGNVKVSAVDICHTPVVKRSEDKEELVAPINKTSEIFQSSGINVYEYAECRAFEIVNLQHALKEAKYAQNGRVFQRLPRHMRRRAASHDVRRIPKRLREKAKNEKVVPKKPPSRKYKRRPRNLLNEYNCRSKSHAWLETHMWHVKRFKMIDQWGYRLPEKPCGKSFRAVYRASAKSCLLQDASYMEFIEIVGCHQVIVSSVERLTNPNTFRGGGEVSDEKCVSGKCYCEEILYTHDTYPYNVIGCVKMIWSSSSKLLVICHPTISSEIMKELQVVFHKFVHSQASANVSNLKDVGLEGDVVGDNIKQDHLKTSQIVTDVVEIDIKLHKLDFVLFSLTGPLSFQILQNVFTFAQSCGEGVDDNEKWKNVTKSSVNEERCSLYNLSVEDPRFHIPHKKQNPFTPRKVESKCSGGDSIDHPQVKSLLWDVLTRKRVKEEKLSDEEINKMRNQQLIPGSTLPHKSVEIPVVLMQRPARSRPSQDSKSYGMGFDIILPSGWAMPFWIALVYQGARVGGVLANEDIALEALSTYFPTQYPDTKSCQQHAINLHRERVEKNKRYPPDKRINFDKLGMKNPFSIPWLHLVSEWKQVIKLLLHQHTLLVDVEFSKGEQRFHVLREETLLHHLKTLLCGNVEKKEKEDMLGEILTYPDSVILVNILPLQGGVPKENATLCLPTCEDIALVHGESDRTHGSGIASLFEPKHAGYKRDFPYICKKFDILLPNAATVGGNSRWIVGYVQNGKYSFSKGKGSGVGFISAIALYYLLCVSKDTSKLLFRNTNTFDYLFCTFDILL